MRVKEAAHRVGWIGAVRGWKHTKGITGWLVLGAGCRRCQCAAPPGEAKLRTVARLYWPGTMPGWSIKTHSASKRDLESKF